METMDNKTISETGIGKRAFLTGAFGMVGEWVLRELLALGYEVTCFDKASPVTQKKAQKLAKSLPFKAIWGDLTDQACVMSALGQAKPTHIAHVAAIIPPLSVKNPGLAYRVNVEGTRNLVAAAELLQNLQRFVNVSSYSVYGPCNPNRNPPLWTSATPLNPQDDYATQKAEAEKIVRTSRLPYTIVRLCAVLPVERGDMDPDSMLFSYILPYDRRSQAIDVRDAALAITKALHLSGLEGRAFVVGGGEGWKMTGGDMSNKLTGALGMPPAPREASRLPDPNVDASWFYENWVDTSESQSVLQYQRYSFDEYLAEFRRRMGPVRFILPLFAGALQKSMLKQSPYYGKAQLPDSRTFAEAASEVLNRKRNQT
jgi:nucleoside-diphosphate-sugar epimerase